MFRRTLYDIRIPYNIHFAAGAEPQVSQKFQVYSGQTSKQTVLPADKGRVFAHPKMTKP